jgi:CBS domain-containing protein
VADVAEVMFSQGVSAVAVVDRTGIVGICTDRDLARALAAGKTSIVPVVDVMTEAPDMVSPDVTVADAAIWLLETGYRHLPVVEDGELLGILDVRDVLWALVPKPRTGDT